MGLLTAKDILAANDLEPVVLEIPEWDGSVRVRGATAAEMDAYDQSIMKTKVGESDNIEVESNLDNAKARLVAKCLVDEDGERLFDDSPEDAEKLGRKSVVAINRIFQKILVLSGRDKASRRALEGN